MFHRCKNLAEGKKLFRILALRLHPDSGGDSELMGILLEAFDAFKESLDGEKETFRNSRTHEEKSKSDRVDKKRCQDVFDFIFRMGKKHHISKFVFSVDKFFRERGYLTKAQFQALVEVMIRIDDDLEEERKQS